MVGLGNRWNSRRLNQTIAAAMDSGETPQPGLHWDLFLGPAPEVPFHPIYHPFNWRGWVDWGTGGLGDMGGGDREGYEGEGAFTRRAQNRREIGSGHRRGGSEGRARSEAKGSPRHP